MTPDDILRFCFPAGLDNNLDRHFAFWRWLMRGGADTEIVARFSGLPPRAAAGDFDTWSATAQGRLAQIVVLDQFPRTLYRGQPAAYAHDAQALALTEQGLANGQFDQLATP